MTRARLHILPSPPHSVCVQLCFAQRGETASPSEHVVMARILQRRDRNVQVESCKKRGQTLFTSQEQRRSQDQYHGVKLQGVAGFWIFEGAEKQQAQSKKQNK